MKNLKNGAFTRQTKKQLSEVLSVIAPLYFFALLLAGILIAFIFK
jgi:hypothetical protein